MRKGFLCNKKGFSPPATDKEGDGKGSQSLGKRATESPRTIIDVVEDLPLDPDVVAEIKRLAEEVKASGVDICEAPGAPGAPGTEASSTEGEIIYGTEGKVGYSKVRQPGHNMVAIKVGSRKIQRS